MRIQYIVLIIMGVIFALMFGSFLFGISFGFLPEENIIKEIARIYEHRTITFFLAIFLYSVSYIVTKSLIKRLTREEIYVAEGELGRVAISIVAVEEALHKILRRFDNIKKYKLHGLARGRKLTIRIFIREWEGEAVKESMNLLQQEVKARLDKMTGMKDNYELDIKIEKFVDAEPVEKKVQGAV